MSLLSGYELLSRYERLIARRRRCSPVSFVTVTTPTSRRYEKQAVNEPEIRRHAGEG